MNLGRVSSGSSLCAGGIFDLTAGSSIGQGGGNPSWVVGATFLKNVYSVFRSQPAAVGFAELSNAAGGSSGECCNSAASLYWEMCAHSRNFQLIKVPHLLLLLLLLVLQALHQAVEAEVEAIVVVATVLVVVSILYYSTPACPILTRTLSFLQLRLRSRFHPRCSWQPPPLCSLTCSKCHLVGLLAVDPFTAYRHLDGLISL